MSDRPVAQQHVTVWQQHRGEVEPLEAHQVAFGDSEAVPGDTDVVHQPLVAGLGERLHRAPRAVRDVELVVFDQIVELDEIDVVDPESVQ
jgi:hypothetical protein